MPWIFKPGPAVNGQEEPLRGAARERPSLPLLLSSSGIIYVPGGDACQIAVLPLLSAQRDQTSSRWMTLMWPSAAARRDLDHNCAFGAVVCTREKPNRRKYWIIYLKAGRSERTRGWRSSAVFFPHAKPPPVQHSLSIQLTTEFVRSQTNGKEPMYIWWQLCISICQHQVL